MDRVTIYENYQEIDRKLIDRVIDKLSEGKFVLDIHKEIEEEDKAQVDDYIFIEKDLAWYKLDDDKLFVSADKSMWLLVNKAPFSFKAHHIDIIERLGITDSGKIIEITDKIDYGLEESTEEIDWHSHPGYIDDKDIIFDSLLDRKLFVTKVVKDYPDLESYKYAKKRIDSLIEMLVSGKHVMINDKGICQYQNSSDNPGERTTDNPCGGEDYTGKEHNPISFEGVTDIIDKGYDGYDELVKKYDSDIVDDVLKYHKKEMSPRDIHKQIETDYHGKGGKSKVKEPEQKDFLKGTPEGTIGNPCPVKAQIFLYDIKNELEREVDKLVEYPSQYIEEMGLNPTDYEVVGEVPDHEKQSIIIAEKISEKYTDLEDYHKNRGYRDSVMMAREYVKKEILPKFKK